MKEQLPDVFFYLKKLKVHGALLIWKQKRTKANKWRPNYLALRSEFSPYWTSGTYLMSPCCCSLVSENKEKWLMLPCYCYIIYTSNLFLWLITGLVRYIGKVKRCGRRSYERFKAVSVKLCKVSMYITWRKICIKYNFFQGWSFVLALLSAAGFPSASVDLCP